MQNGLQAIHLAAQEGQEEVLRFLIEKHNINTVSLHISVYTHYLMTLTYRVDISYYTVLATKAKQLSYSFW